MTVDEQLRPGLKIADRYELQKLLGEGGMGQVWKARHIRLDSPVAIKFLRQEGGEAFRFRDRFEREAQLAASVKHRNVVTIMDYGETAEGFAYMVMDYLEGEPFANYVRGAFPTEEVVHLVIMALRGLGAVHEVGIVHRDLKPDNIFLVRDASGVYPKLLDFGISRQTDQTQSKRSAVTTQQGLLLGTPAYMSPEQARGLHDIDRRTDIYSMGVLLYEALAGQLPFEAEHVGDLMVQVISGRPKHLHELCPSLPSPLCDAVMKAITRDRDERFQTADEMRAALLATLASDHPTLLSDRPSPPISSVGSRESPPEATNEPFSSLMPSPPRDQPTVGDAVPPLSALSLMNQTLDGTAIEVGKRSGSHRRWLLATGVIGLACVIIGIVLALRGDVTEIEATTPGPAMPTVAATARPEPAAGQVPPPTLPAAPELEPAETVKSDVPAVVVDAGAEVTASKARRPATRPSRSKAKRPANPSKSKVLTELDY